MGFSILVPFFHFRFGLDTLGGHRLHERLAPHSDASGIEVVVSSLHFFVYMSLIMCSLALLRRFPEGFLMCKDRAYLLNSQGILPFSLPYKFISYFHGFRPYFEAFIHTTTFLFSDVHTDEIYGQKKALHTRPPGWEVTVRRARELT